MKSLNFFFSLFSVYVKIKIKIESSKSSTKITKFLLRRKNYYFKCKERFSKSHDVISILDTWKNEKKSKTRIHFPSPSSCCRSNTWNFHFNFISSLSEFFHTTDYRSISFRMMKSYKNETMRRKKFTNQFRERKKIVYDSIFHFDLALTCSRCWLVFVIACSLLPLPLDFDVIVAIKSRKYDRLVWSELSCGRMEAHKRKISDNEWRRSIRMRWNFFGFIFRLANLQWPQSWFTLKFFRKIELRLSYHHLTVNA